MVHITTEELGERATASNLTISEIMYHPGASTEAEKNQGISDAEEFEFIEFLAIGTKAISFAGVRLIDGVQYQFDRWEPLLQKGQCLILAKNPKAFRVRYPGVTCRVLGPYSGTLRNKGERLTILDSASQKLLRFSYEDKAPWPASADGLGFSIIQIDPDNRPDLGKATSWRASAQAGGSPGTDEPSARIPGIVINEVLTNSDPPTSDVIELHNPTDRPVDVGGWFLTDDAKEPKKWHIPAGTIIPANGYWVAYEDNDGDPSNNDSLSEDFFGKAFSLRSLGEEVFLFAADAQGELSGYSDGFRFNATLPGHSLGRYDNASGKNMIVLQLPTLGAPNGRPLIGDVVITEILYQPSSDDSEETGEFVELVNHSSHPVDLFEAKHPEKTWEIEGIDYRFPQGITLAPGEIILVTRTELEEFRRRNRVPANVRLFGPPGGKLANNGERITLAMPVTAEASATSGQTSLIAIDSVRYNDKAPWPEDSQKKGHSLERQSPKQFGDDPNAWHLSARPGGTPGRLSQ